MDFVGRVMEEALGASWADMIPRPRRREELAGVNGERGHSEAILPSWMGTLPRPGGAEHPGWGKRPRGTGPSTGCLLSRALPWQEKLWPLAASGWGRGGLGGTRVLEVSA